MTQRFHDMEEKLTNLQEEAMKAGLKPRKGVQAKMIKNQIKEANAAFSQLYPIWRNKYISKKTKVCIVIRT
jgi:hypothetical protein